MAKGLVQVDFGVVQVAVLGVACLVAGIGVYTLATNRLPPLFFLRIAHYAPRRYGWGVLLIAAFGFTSTLGADVAEPGSWPDMALFALSCGFFVSGTGLVMSSTKRSRRPF
ncbi:hypothetical protein ACFQ08_23900 [Streptosporangium algeriense]|uniref:Uncharacterized protein n=1 Tax=Streptosporangium algeriense TaxID=1682748 RepID=A0ABW3DUT6_9ACTN